MILSPSKDGRVDPVVFNILKNIQTDATLVPVTRLRDFVFNDELLKLNKYVLVDFVENGWDWNMQETHLFGQNTFANFSRLFQGEEWKKFDDFVAHNPPHLYFKRELLKKDFKSNVHPIEYPCFNQPYIVQDKETFDSRPVQTFMNWGLSHPRRRQLHGEIFIAADKYGYDVVDNFHNFQGSFNDGHKKVWATINTPHFARIPITQVLACQNLSKISVSMAGAGRKCFRTTGESPINAVMMLPNDDIAYSYEWSDGYNCIKTDEGKEIETLVEALKNENLYEIYLRGVENCNKYQLNTYLSDYILPTINKYL